MKIQVNEENYNKLKAAGFPVEHQQTWFVFFDTINDSQSILEYSSPKIIPNENIEIDLNLDLFQSDIKWINAVQTPVETPDQQTERLQKEALVGFPSIRGTSNIKRRPLQNRHRFPSDFLTFTINWKDKMYMIEDKPRYLLLINQIQRKMNLMPVGQYLTSAKWREYLSDISPSALTKQQVGKMIQYLIQYAHILEPISRAKI